jgi:hypothetical protein
MRYESVVEIRSEKRPEVTFVVARASFGRRLELARQIRELAMRSEFLAASKDAADQMESRLIRGEMERVYLRHGLREVRGLEIDGSPATPESLVESGPEELAAEAVRLVGREYGVTDEERKN